MTVSYGGVVMKECFSLQVQFSPPKTRGVIKSEIRAVVIKVVGAI